MSEQIEDLVRKLQSGDKKAGEKLLCIFKPLVKSIRQNYKHKLISPFDIEQQANMLLYEAFLKYDFRDGIYAVNYISTYVKLNFKNWWRSEIKYINNFPVRLYNDIVDEKSDYYSDNEYSKCESNLMFDDMLKYISDEIDRKILVDYFIHDMSQEEIAYEININQSSVARRLQKSLEKLKKVL